MIYIVAGGSKDNIPDLLEVAKENPNSIWIGVDAGTLTILESGLTPNFVIGDFDSVTEVEFENIRKYEMLKFSSEKDQSDLELALDWAILNDQDPIVIFGATGNRLDHELVNIMLLTKYSEKREIWVKDKKNELTVLFSGKHELIRNNMKYISFISLDERLQKVSFTGLKYPLDDSEILRNSTLGLSNEFVAPVCTILFETGICLVVRSSD